MAATSREKLASLIHSAKLAIDIPSKLDSLRKLKTELPQEDPVILTEFLPQLFEFLSDCFSPVRKFVTEYFHLSLFLLYIFGCIVVWIWFWRRNLRFFLFLSGWRMIGEIGLMNTEFLPEIVPVLIDVLDDDTPAVVRQAILCGIDLFRYTLEKIAVQVINFFFNSNSFQFSWLL